MKLKSWWTWFNLLVQKFRKLIFDFNTFNVWWDDKSWSFCHPLLAVLSILSPGCGKTARPPRLTRRTCVFMTLVVLRFAFLRGPSRSSSCLIRSFSGLFRSFPGPLRSFSCLFRSLSRSSSGLFRSLSRSSKVRFDLKEPACQPCTTQQSTESRLSVWKDWSNNLWLLITCDYWSEEVNTSRANRQQREDEEPKSAKGGTCKNEHDLQGIYFSKVEIQFFLCSFTFTPFQSRAPTGMESREIGMKTKLVINFINSETWFIGFIFFYNF